jgi:DNA-binding MarR family transcriptional regulator
MQSHKIYDYIERLSNLLRNDSRRGIAEFGLQPIQLEALHYLSICNRYSDTPMAATEYLGQTKGTVSQTLKVLEKKGLLSRHVDSHDKRVTHLKVTAAGQSVLLASIPSPLFVQACKGLSAAVQLEIEDTLEKLLSTLQHSNNMKTFGVCSSCGYNQRNLDGSYLCQLTREPLTSVEVELICREHQAVA